MHIAAVLPLAVLLIVVCVVAARLLLLARRTRGLPEFSIGAGLVLMILVGMPLCVLGRLPALEGTPVGGLLFAIGTLVVCQGMTFLFVFTWTVFRPRSAWAQALVACGWLGLVVIAAGMLHANAGGGELAAVLARTRPWAISMVAFLGVAFGWSGLESYLYWRPLVRRCRLGLADPVIANRFVLWAAVGATTAGLCGTVAALIASGRVVLHDPFSLTLIAVFGSLSCVAWYLSFLAPARYQAWLRSRAAGSR